MENILISIIVPVYNNETYLEELILSLGNQTLTPPPYFEIIFLDDNSTDNSLETLQFLIEKYLSSKEIFQFPSFMMEKIRNKVTDEIKAYV